MQEPPEEAADGAEEKEEGQSVTLSLVVVMAFLPPAHPAVVSGEVGSIRRRQDVLQTLATLMLGPGVSSMEETLESSDLGVECLPFVFHSLAGGGGASRGFSSAEDLGAFFGMFLRSAAAATALVSHGESG